MTSAIKELEEFGYLVRTRVQDEKGLFRYIYDVYENPCTENPCTDNPCTDNPCTDNVPLLNTKELNTKEPNIKEPNTKDIRGDKPPTPTKRTRFTPPTVEEVEDYCRERDNGIDAEHFIDYYEARGWELSKGRKVKDWKACVRTWERNNRSKPARKAGEGKNPDSKERLNLESIIRELPEESQDAVREYVTMRERTNHPIATENTLIRAIKKAKEFAGDDTRKFTRIFEQSVDHSWQGVYDLKEDAPREKAASIWDA